MKKTAVAIAVMAAIGAGVVLMRRRGGADSEPGETSTDETTSFEPEQTSYDNGAASWLNVWTDQAQTEIESYTMPLPPMPKTSNIAAMLDTISKAEGTNRGDSYRVCYGYKHTIASFADHPAITGEWRGEPLSDAMCKGAGFGPGCVSSAAGRYQIKKSTWETLKKRLKLQNFNPESQDAAAVELLRECGALALLEAGDFEKAVFAARKIWASLPGAGYGQGEKSLKWLTARFVEAGGVLA